MIGSETMNILEHSIYKDIYDLCGEIEKLPASEQATKVVTMASALERPTAKLIEALREIKLTALTTTNASDGKDGPIVWRDEDTVMEAVRSLNRDHDIVAQ